MTANVSIQTPDYESQVSPMTREEALEQLAGWPWQEQLQRQAEIESTGDEACPPNISFAVGDRSVMVMGVGTGVFDLLVMSHRSVRRFGLWKHTEDLSWEIQGVDMETAVHFVTLVFADAPEMLNRHAESFES